MAGLTKKSPNEQKIKLQERNTEQVINNKGVKKHRVKGKGKKTKIPTKIQRFTTHKKNDPDESTDDSSNDNIP